MGEKIYYGDVDLINIKTGEITTIHNVVYKASALLSDVCSNVLKSISVKDRPNYKIKRFHLDRAKVIGESCI